MKETKSIMIVGVGGQGTLLASRILGNVFIGAGYDVKVSEVHGMSQRGGRDRKINPMPVITGAAEYPAGIKEKLAKTADVTAVDAQRFAEEAGNIKAVNVVLIGLLAKNTEIPHDAWLETIKKTVPAKFLDVNIKAFELGYSVE